jgi:hypothetical protein
MHSKICVSRFSKTNYNLKRRKYICVTNSSLFNVEEYQNIGVRVIMVGVNPGVMGLSLQNRARQTEGSKS